MTAPARSDETAGGAARICPECGAATIRIEFRDQFAARRGVPFDPRSNGMWIVCEVCQHEWDGS